MVNDAVQCPNLFYLYCTCIQHACLFAATQRTFTRPGPWPLVEKFHCSRHPSRFAPAPAPAATAGMGFPQEWFIDDVDEELLCGICMEVFKTPVTACRELHTFCSECMSDVRKSTNPRCPSCRDPLAPSVTANRLLDNMIAKKKMRCPNAPPSPIDSADERVAKQPRQDTAQVCSWIGPLSELSSHRQVCSEELVECPRGCVQRVRRRLLNRHLQNDCPNRTVTCAHCNDSVRAIELALHERRCPKKLASCPRQCGATLRREQLAFHERMCPREPVCCPFSGVGCTARPERRGLQAHQVEAADAHAKLSASKIEGMEKKLARMERLIEAKLGGLDDDSPSNARPPMQWLMSPRTGNRPEMDRKFDSVERDVASLQSSVKTLQDHISHRELNAAWEIEADLLSDSHETLCLESHKAWVSPNYQLYLQLESKSRTGQVMAYIMLGDAKWTPIRIGGSSIMVESARGDDLTIQFSDSDEIKEDGAGVGYQLAATRAQLRSRIQDGKLRIEAKLRVKEFDSVHL